MTPIFRTLTVCPARPSRAAVTLRAVAGLVFVLAAFTGCQEPLFSADEPRSQYDRFDVVRETRAPGYVMDEFGRKRPNVRSRLLIVE